MKHVDGYIANFKHVGCGKFLCPDAVINIPAHSGDWSNFRKRVEDRWVTNISGMNDVVGSTKGGDSLGPEQAMRVRDDADQHLVGNPCLTYRVGFFSVISFLIFSPNSSAGMSSVFSLPRVRTFTLPASASLSPTTNRNGTFCMACSRILAFIFSLRASTSTRTPMAFS